MSNTSNNATNLYNNDVNEYFSHPYHQQQQFNNHHPNHNNASSSSAVAAAAAAAVTHLHPTITVSTRESYWKRSTIALSKCYYSTISFVGELWDSTEVIFHRNTPIAAVNGGSSTTSTSSCGQQLLSYLMIFGPVVVMGDTFQIFDKSICFVLSGISLIPCAERLSFLTEQIAYHTNGTIGALCNATFGNAPELLISIAALRLGYYRVIQLTMLGSMITNMIFVFGVSCLIGGIRYETQSIRSISGNVTIGMLILSTIASLIPATLVLSGQFIDTPTTPTIREQQQQQHVYRNDTTVHRMLLKRSIETITPTQEEITLSRVNASVLIMMYISYIVFQLGTHKHEFDDDNDNNGDANNNNHHHHQLDGSHRSSTSKPNIFCRQLCSSMMNRMKWCVGRVKSNTTTFNDTLSGVSTSNRTTILPLSLTTPSVSPMSIRKKYSDHQPLQSYYDNDYDHPLEYDDDDDDDDDDSVQMAEMVVLLNNRHGKNDANNYHNAKLDDSINDISSSHPDGDGGGGGVVGQHRRRRRNVDVDGSQWKHQQQQQQVYYSSPISSKLNLTKSFDSAIPNSPDRQYNNNHNIRTYMNHPDLYVSAMDASHRTTGTSQSHSVHPHHTTTQMFNNTEQQQQQQQPPPSSSSSCAPAVPVVEGAILSFRISVVWLFIITLCVSAISDILVDTIDEFAYQLNLSQVFTSMIIIPFFSNVAEQVSAFIFAYKNEMDLVIGVTIGSAIQIATFVLPGSVLIGYVLDRSMTLYFHSYETVCLLVCTLIVASILQGGTTNWLVGAMLIGVYIMFAAGIWFHEIENLSVDAEELIDAKD